MWSYKRTAGTQPGWAGLPAVLLLSGLLSLSLPDSSRAEDGNEDHTNLRTTLGIRGGVEVEFLAQRGSVYKVEAQGVDGDWAVVLGPIYGRGTSIRQSLSGLDRALAYRLRSAGLGDFGNAPLVLEGHSYSLNYGMDLVGLNFAALNVGVAGGHDGERRGFAYSYQKLEPDVAELSIEYADGAREALTLQFYHGRIGTFNGSGARGGGREHRISGTFRAGGNVNPDSAVPPPSIEGSRFVFRDSGMSSLISFTTDFSGSLSRAGGPAEVISYSYDPSQGAEAFIEVTFLDSNETHHYALEFKARNSGGFTRRTIRNGRLRDTDRGRFSGKGAEDDDDDGKGGGNSESDCIAPDSLHGRTLQASIGGKVVTILLDGAGTGSILKRRANGGVALQPFEYTYSKETGSEGLLTITLPSGVGEDEIQVFELEFTSRRGGDCVRSRHMGGEEDDTASGSFTLSADEGAAGDINRGGPYNE